MITHELIERIEGEAVLDFKTAKSGVVEHADIRFLHFRGMESILEGRNALDALVIAPRVCGICGHSHLIAAVRMIENAYIDAGFSLTITPKAQAIREITLNCELIQNHLKWLYLVMLHESGKLLAEEPPVALKALYVTSQVNQLCALFSGQWPHSSYALPGGVTCDPTHIEVMQALKLLSEVEQFVAKEVLGCPLEKFELHLKSDSHRVLEGDFSTLLNHFERLNLLDAGKTHGRFLVLGSQSAILSNGEIRNADADLVSEDSSQTFAQGGNTYAKNALYNGDFYESGPLARALIGEREGITALYQQYSDSAQTRLCARMDETVKLISDVRYLLKNLDLSQPSFVTPTAIEYISGTGIGIIEAPRGSLIHRARIEKGKIVSYSIITPTQWNLGSGSPTNLGVAQRAMIGVESIAKASLIFRTFDVCSVCTTH
ncbi:MAG: nickel-dependent hydrogenase large subunit [Sulfuricurvum sp.]|jgi:Ni,Fe-hydrogenase I large subunit|uniref:nickel-dependent hydrogenase large subunit n=1 Tax=Sulfuricurvum sp. TaxID=2025608 RepID=UPI0025EE47C7|nr:nickel-dependent hydrogenase large subunit [Sulfuricurvum sp.]MCI4407394.1 nickel-dependent hydrogenase large subunit [Sulfuricurvum sp.]